MVSALLTRPFIILTCCFLFPVTGNIVLELSKDKHNASLLDRQLVQFQGSVNRVESELSGQIRYLTQVKQHSRSFSSNICVLRLKNHCYNNNRALLCHGRGIVSV